MDAAEGRVEIFIGTEWGTVCDDGWDLKDATVACRQLGSFGALEARKRTTSRQAPFGEGTGPIHAAEFRCEGTETRLIDCRHARDARDFCSHSEDAGVVCDAGSALVSPASVSVGEEDATGGQYLLGLGRQPLADVAVSVAGTSGTDVTVSPATTTFTTVNWDEGRTVTVTAAADADAENDVVTLTHSASGGGYDLAMIPSVQVTVMDNDGANAAPYSPALWWRIRRRVRTWVRRWTRPTPTPTR